MAKTPKVIYYQDELNDEFSGDSIRPRPITGDYPYLKTGLCARFRHILAYRILATSFAFCFLKIRFHHKIVNRQVLKAAKGQGFFLYGNHTQAMADPFVPSMVCFPRAAYVVVHPNNVSMPVLGRITPYLGAMPLPDDMQAAKNFVRAIETRIEEKNCVMIYPEAHIWPYYTDIRPFLDASFRYPVKCGAPVFCLTNTYQKRRFSKRPKMVTYVDGPFYPAPDAPPKQQRQQLRDAVYARMKERAKQNTVCVIHYEKKEPTP